MAALSQCRKDNSIALWWGACSDAKIDLTACLAAAAEMQQLAGWVAAGLRGHANCASCTQVMLVCKCMQAPLPNAAVHHCAHAPPAAPYCDCRAQASTPAKQPSVRLQQQQLARRKQERERKEAALRLERAELEADCFTIFAA